MTKDEVIKILDVVMTAGTANNASKELSSIAKGVYRIFDVNGDGSIQDIELDKILCDITKLALNLATHVLQHFENIAIQEALGEMVNTFIEYLRLELSKENTVQAFSIDDLLGLFNGHYTNEELIGIFKELDNLDDELPGIKNVLDAFAEQFRHFFSQLDSIKKADNMIETSRCVKIGLLCVKNVLDVFEQEGNKQLGKTILKMAMQDINELQADCDEENPMKRIEVQEGRVYEIIKAVFGGIRDFLIDEGLSDYLMAFFKLFEAESSGMIDLRHLMALGEMVKSSIASRESYEFKNNVVKLQGAVFYLISMLDSDNNKFVERAELATFGKKVIKLLFSWIVISLNMAHHVFCSAEQLVVKLALDVKNQILGGNDLELTHADLSFLALCFGFAEGETNFIDFALEMLSSASSTIEKKALEDLCRPTLRLALGTSEVREATIEFFR